MNMTWGNSILLVEGLKITPQSSYPVFILLLMVYLFVMGCNIGIIILISIDKNLHHPMHLLFFNMPVSDLLGITVILPRLLQDILREASERYISYVDCVVQAYFVHTFGAVSLNVLMIMAFDRYLAVCYPLRYKAIMTNKMVLNLSALAWGVSVPTVMVLIGLTLRLSQCRYKIENPFCDNASLFKLSCEQGVAINNAYGIFSTVLCLTLSVGSAMITYGHIAVVCSKSKNKALNIKAIKTCSTHIAVYLITILSCATMIFLHRFPQYTDSRKLSSIMFHIVPPGLNPLVYGLQLKEIRQRTVRICCRNKVNVKKSQKQ